MEVARKAPVFDTGGIDAQYALGFEWLKEHLAGWQFGEEGLVAALALKLKQSGGSFVEFGAGDPDQTSLTCATLAENGWRGLVMDSDADVAAASTSALSLHPRVSVIHQEIAIQGESSLDEVLKREKFTDADVLVIDVDSIDWYLWDSLKGCKPSIVVVEHHDLADDKRNRYMPAPVPEACGEMVNEYSLQATARAVGMLGGMKGYYHVAATRCNSLFVSLDVVNRLGRFGDEVRLNIGAGKSQLPGFTPVDIDDGIDARKLPYEDGSVAEIYASHVLEHFSHRDTIAVIREWVRVLKPHGTIRIAVPDQEKALDLMRTGKIPFNVYESYIVGGHTDQHDKHGALFTKQKLSALMHYVGLEDLSEWESKYPDCSAIDVSLNLQGRKRAFTKKENPTVIAVLSLPRIGFTSMFFSLHKALRAVTVKSVYHGPKSDELGPIVDDLVHCGGAFWEKYLTAGIERGIAVGGDYLLFADYDSVFTAEDVLKLIDVLNNDQSVSCAFAVQASRHNDRPLVHIDKIEYIGEQTQVPLAHFGLTVIRAEVFRYLPRPWLWSMPNPDSLRWDEEGHCDADITFWRVLTEFGHKIVQVNDVQAGHMDLCVKWLTEKGIAYQPVKNYEKLGKPKFAVFTPSTVMPVKPKTPPVAAQNGATPNGSGVVGST